eukprot:ANDGO_02455.mRNA.1 hypothetical protein
MVSCAYLLINVSMLMLGTGIFLISTSLFVTLDVFVDYYGKSVGVWLGIANQSATVVGILLLLRPYAIVHHIFLFLLGAFILGVATTLSIALAAFKSVAILYVCAALGGLVATIVFPAATILASWTCPFFENAVDYQAVDQHSSSGGFFSFARDAVSESSVVGSHRFLEKMQHSQSTSVSVGLAFCGLLSVALSFAFADSVGPYFITMSGVYGLGLVLLGYLYYMFREREDHEEISSVLSPASIQDPDPADYLDRIQSNGQRFNLACQFLSSLLVYITVPGLFPLIGVEGSDLRIAAASFLIGNLCGRLVSYFRWYIPLLVGLPMQFMCFFSFFLIVRLTSIIWVLSSVVFLFSAMNGILATEIMMVTNRVKYAITTKCGSVLGSCVGLIILYIQDRQAFG